MIAFWSAWHQSDFAGDSYTNLPPSLESIRCLALSIWEQGGGRDSRVKPDRGPAGMPISWSAGRGAEKKGPARVGRGRCGGRRRRRQRSLAADIADNLSVLRSPAGDGGAFL
jgi:hypothetical protein